MDGVYIMTKARTTGDLLDTNGDIKSANLDNVPASDNASALTTGTLPAARIGATSITVDKMNLGASTGSIKLPTGTTGQRPTGAVGEIRFDTTEGVFIYHDGTSWKKVSSVLAVLNSISGSIYAGTATTLTLAGTGFLSSNLVVNFAQSSDSIDENVTVTASSDIAATVAVPSAVYSNVTAGNAVTIKVTNIDASQSAGVNTTAVALPSGGSITTSGSNRIHTFTSSGTFTNTLSLTNVEYLVIAGGGGGASRHAGGGGAGGYRSSVVGESSGRNSSAESRQNINAGSYSVTVGAGGAGGSGSSGVGSQGSNSVFNGITSTGGGGGHNDGDTQAFMDGGSGGGASYDAQGGDGTAGQGHDGGDGVSSGIYGGAGGGGAGAVGANGSSTAGGNGGNGLSSSITGSAVTRAGGGGGTNHSGSGTTGSGGSGGGGNAGNNSNGSNGTANTGGGAGGGDPSTTGGTGGSGVVIISYQL